MICLFDDRVLKSRLTGWITIDADHLHGCFLPIFFSIFSIKARSKRLVLNLHLQVSMFLYCFRRRVVDAAARDGLPQVRVREEGLHRPARGCAHQRHPPALVAALHRLLGPGQPQPGESPVGHRQHPGRGLGHQPVHPARQLRRWSVCFVCWGVGGTETQTPPAHLRSVYASNQRAFPTRRAGASTPTPFAPPASAETRPSTCTGPTRTRTTRTTSWRPASSSCSPAIFCSLRYGTTKAHSLVRV